jgi:uncharacterized protein
MSGAPEVRRTDRLLSEQDTLALVEQGFSGVLATVGSDGYPYAVPLLHVWMNGKIYVHSTAAKGHLRSNVDHESRVCFTVDQPGEIFAYGRFECDTSVSYASTIVFGQIAVVEDCDEKTSFCDALMAKYGRKDWGRPEGFYPRLDHITVYAIEVERMTGKFIPLPQVSEQWPAHDRSASPKAKPSA